MEDEVDVSEKNQKKKDLNKIFWSIKKIAFLYQNNWKKRVSSNIAIFFIHPTNKPNQLCYHLRTGILL